MEDFQKRSFAQLVVDKDGQPLRAFPDSQGVWRYPIQLSEISPYYLQALINYEDRHFYSHMGIDPLAVTRAFGQWIWNGKPVSGASTLTMQVARILSPHKKTLAGKLKQMFMALQLEWHYNKNEILYYYVNYAPFGGTIEGVQAASYAYFGKNASQLSHSEAALLAVMPQSPSRFRPDRYPQRAEKARNKLLNRLKEYAVWEESVINDALQEPVWAEYNTHPMIAPLLARRLKNQHTQDNIIRTTIDKMLQSELETLIKDYIQTKSEKMSAALLLVDNSSMSALAYIGSADFLNETRAGHIDMIQSIRSPGSTLKPLIYGMAIDEGLIHSQSLLFDIPQSFNGYRPKNFSGVFHGAVSVSLALRQSLNMPAVQVLNALTAEKFYARMQNSGLNLQLPELAKPNLSLALGGGGVDMEHLTGVFSSIGRDGKSAKVRLTREDKLNETETLSPGSAWIIQNILAQANIEKINSHHFSNHSEIAFKTGTSYGSRDAWVLATNKIFTIAIWLGQPDGAPVVDNTGRNSAVPLLQRVLSVLPHEWMEQTQPPLSVSNEKICWPLGTRKDSQPEGFCHKIKNAMLLDGSAPPTMPESNADLFSSYVINTTVDTDEGLRVLPQCYQGNTTVKQYAVWPRSLEPWIAKPYRRSSFLPPYNPDCKILQSHNSLKISGLHDRSTIYPESSSTHMPDIVLNSEGANGKNYWFVNGVLQQDNNSKLLLSHLESGKYKVTLIDDSANFAEIEFTVKI